MVPHSSRSGAKKRAEQMAKEEAAAASQAQAAVNRSWASDVGFGRTFRAFVQGSCLAFPPPITQRPYMGNTRG